MTIGIWNTFAWTRWGHGFLPIILRLHFPNCLRGMNCGAFAIMTSDTQMSSPRQKVFEVF